MNTDHVVLIGTALLVCHLHKGQFLLGLLQTGSLGIVLDDTVFQILHPFVKGSLRNFVELVDTEQEILREHLLGQVGCQQAIVEILHVFLGKAQQRVFLGHAPKLRLAVVSVVLALTQIEIQDVDRIHLLDVLIALAKVYLLGDGL